MRLATEKSEQNASFRNYSSCLKKVNRILFFLLTRRYKTVILFYVLKRRKQT